MLQLSRGWCHISVENCICSWLRLSYFIILGSLLCNESLFHDLLFHNLLLTSNYRCQINVVKWSAMFPSAVFTPEDLRSRNWEYWGNNEYFCFLRSNPGCLYRFVWPGGSSENLVSGLHRLHQLLPTQVWISVGGGHHATHLPWPLPLPVHLLSGMDTHIHISTVCICINIGMYEHP